MKDIDYIKQIKTSSFKAQAASSLPFLAITFSYCLAQKQWQLKFMAWHHPAAQHECCSAYGKGIDEYELPPVDVVNGAHMHQPYLSLNVKTH